MRLLRSSLIVRQADDIPESEVDAGGDGLLRFRNAMPPVMLQATAHQQQAAAGKVYLYGFSRLVVANLKQPSST